jgi:hypothetical protein
VRIPIEKGANLVAIVSKGNLSDVEIGFALEFRAICTCGGQPPDTCLGNLGRDFRVNGGLVTTNAFSKQTLACGSKQSNLRSFVFSFQVSESGVYRVSLLNVKNGNSTLQVAECNGDQFLGCASGNSPEFAGSVVEASLESGRNIYGIVSKFDQNSNEVSIVERAYI